MNAHISNSRRFGEDVLKSLEYLRFKTRSHNAVAASDFIERLLSEQQKYALYREMFPNEWARSQASFYRRGHFKYYSERSNELFKLVDENCFPLLEQYQDDPEIEIDTFSIMPMNADLCCCGEIDPEYLRTSYAFGVIFIYPDETWAFLNEKFGLDESEFPSIKDQPHKNVGRVKDSLYSDLICLVDHSTGNPWLDSTYCHGGDWYKWNRETIEELTAEFEKVDAYFERVAGLDHLIEVDPGRILTDLINFWNTGKPLNPEMVSGNDEPIKQH